MIRKITLVVFVFALIVSFGLYIWSCRLISTASNKSEELMDSLKHLHWRNTYLTDILFHNYNSIGKKVSGIKGEDVKSENLAQIVLFKDYTDKDKFIFRFSTIGCNSCSLVFFDKLKVYLDEMKKKYDIYVLVDFNKYSDFHKWQKTSGIVDGKLLYLKVPAGNLELDEERSSTSYVFTLSKNNVVTSVFVPNSSYPDYIDLYLSNISL